MKTCPKCSGTFPSNYSVCPQDATPLRQASELAEGAILRGKYQIISRIGEGGMGVVYKARHIRFDEICALKLVSTHLAADEEFLRRFHSEAVLMRRLEHPHALRVHDIDETEDGRPFIVMEFFAGRSLDKLVREEGPLAVARACRIVAQACSALDAAHRLGIVHRDIKPSNIMVAMQPDGSEIAKVFDFGIAKVKDTSELRQGVSLTRTGFLVGTPAYMSPEQAQGVRGDKLDGRSDLYSLGIVLFEILTGQLPFQDQTPASLLIAHLQAPPPNPREIRGDIPEPLAAIILRAMEKEPAQRFASAAEMQVALDALSGESALGRATAISSQPVPRAMSATEFTQRETPIPNWTPQRAHPAATLAAPAAAPPPTAAQPRESSATTSTEEVATREAQAAAPAAATRSFLTKVAVGLGAVIVLAGVMIYQTLQDKGGVTPGPAEPVQPAPAQGVTPAAGQPTGSLPAQPVASQPAHVSGQAPGGTKPTPSSATGIAPEQKNDAPPISIPAQQAPLPAPEPSRPTASTSKPPDDYIPPVTTPGRPSPTEVPGTVDLSAYLAAIAASDDGMPEVTAAPPGFADASDSDAEDAPTGFRLLRARQRNLYGVEIEQMILRSNTEVLSVFMAPANVPFYVGYSRISMVNLGGVTARTIDAPGLSVYEIPVYGMHYLFVGKSIRPERMTAILRAMLSSN